MLPTKRLILWLCVIIEHCVYQLWWRTSVYYCPIVLTGHHHNMIYAPPAVDPRLFFRGNVHWPRCYRRFIALCVAQWPAIYLLVVYISRRPYNSLSMCYIILRLSCDFLICMLVHRAGRALILISSVSFLLLFIRMLNHIPPSSVCVFVVVAAFYALLCLYCVVSKTLLPFCFFCGNVPIWSQWSFNYSRFCQISATFICL